MEAAARAFEDWEFRILEQESGIDEEDEEKDGEVEKEISCQQLTVSTAQVNRATAWEDILQLLPDLFVAYQYVMCFMSRVKSPTGKACDVRAGGQNKRNTHFW